jgi:ketosteroid isomerase-like protein
MYTRVRYLGLLLLLLATTPAVAQPTDEAHVRAVIQQLFDAMRAGDGAAVAALFHPEATLKSVVEVAGETRVQRGDATAFAAQVGVPGTDVWDERIANLEVHVDGPLATAWMDYAFYIGPRFSHCGVNAMMLVQTAAGWRFLDITDTRRTSECRVPS